MISRDGIARTYKVIGAHVRRTPVIETDAADFGLGTFQAVFKLEMLQRAGSFKTRGAFANLLLRELPAAGVVAASGGNHGVAVAYAAQRLGVRARVFVPAVASPAKIARIRDSGAELTICGERYADALEESERCAASSGALPIHAFDQAETLLGQGTLGLELEEQVSRLDTLLVAVGGGGLLGGLAAWYEERIRLIAVEPEAAGLRRDTEGRVDHPLVVQVARPQHHPVLAEGDRMTIAIGGDVPNGQRWHDASLAPTKHVSRHGGTGSCDTRSFPQNDAQQ